MKMRDVGKKAEESFFKLGIASIGLTVIAACTSVPQNQSDGLAQSEDEPSESVVVQSDVDWRPSWQGAGVTWHSRSFPGKKVTQYVATTLDGRDAIHSDSRNSASLMRQRFHMDSSAIGQIEFAWKVPHLIPGADMGLRDHDDSPVRVMLAFEGDRSRLSVKDAMLSELARAVTGEELPYATLMYVWCNSRRPGVVIFSPRTDRIRSIVVESGPSQLNQWIDYRRDIQADFETAFGEKPGALVGVAIMSDSDNTRSEASAWYGPVRISTVAPSH